MGMGGYHNLYQEELPVYSFSDHSDKWGHKKSLRVWDKPIANIHTVEAMSDIYVKTREHYTFNVGAAYSVCSHLTLQAVNAAVTDRGSEEFQNILKACGLAWRGVYEGKGLSGFSKSNSQFFEILTAACFDPANKLAKRVVVEKDGTEMVRYQPKFMKAKILENETKVSEDIIATIPVLIENLAKDDMFVSEDVVGLLVMARSVTSCYGKIERKGLDSFSSKDGRQALIDTAIVSGAFRRLGQGNDPVEVVAEDIYLTEEEQEEGPQSLMEAFNERNLSTFIKEPNIAELLSCGTLYHTVLREVIG